MITLYVKTHLVTGLKYFGKTTRRDFNTYKGSGKHWLRHISKHGNHVHTYVVGQYEDSTEATQVALAFSVEHDIVKSKEWANLIPENGLDGLPPGMKPFVPTDETRLRWSEAGKRRWKDPVKRAALVQAQKDSWDDTRRLKNADLMKTAWTADRRESHSSLLKANYARNPSMVESISKRFKDMVRTDAHKKNISIALSGKAKSFESIIKLRWTRMGGVLTDTPITLTIVAIAMSVTTFVTIILR